MSEAIYYDVATLLIPEAVTMLREYEHPQRDELMRAADRLRHVIISAYERARSAPLPAEVTRFRDVMRYGLLSLKRIFTEGDWRSHIFFNELLYEVEAVKYLLEWLLSVIALPSGATLLDANSVTPIFSARVSTRMGARVVLTLEERLAEISLVREVVDEYFRRYGISGQVLKVGPRFSTGAPRESVDCVFFGSLDSWTLGWDAMLSAASMLLKPRGVLAYLLPANYREGLRTLLALWGIPPYPEPAAAAAQLKNMKFRDVRVNVRGPFYAIIAQRR
uniref:Class I SAM-dependent methyltransferase n=1 Tax=Thermofilum pendens TaxID=2269 RepID=A0A7C4FC26_THEPE